MLRIEKASKNWKKSFNWRLVYNYAFNQVEDFATFLRFLRKGETKICLINSIETFEQYLNFRIQCAILIAFDSWPIFDFRTGVNCRVHLIQNRVDWVLKSWYTMSITYGYHNGMKSIEILDFLFSCYTCVFTRYFSVLMIQNTFYVEIIV